MPSLLELNKFLISYDNNNAQQQPTCGQLVMTEKYLSIENVLVQPFCQQKSVCKMMSSFGNKSVINKYIQFLVKHYQF